MGAAMLAAVGAELLPDLSAAAARWVQVGHAIRPDSARHEHYHRRLTTMPSCFTP